MQYKKVITAQSDEITETYRIDDVDYHGSLQVHGLGYASGMAGNDEHSVTITLTRDGEIQPLGTITLTFPLVKRYDLLNPQRMREHSDSNDNIRRFSSYALRTMEIAVSQFIATKASWTSLGISIKQVSVAVDIIITQA